MRAFVGKLSSCSLTMGQPFIDSINIIIIIIITQYGSTDIHQVGAIGRSVRAKSSSVVWNTVNPTYVYIETILAAI